MHVSKKKQSYVGQKNAANKNNKHAERKRRRESNNFWTFYTNESMCLESNGEPGEMFKKKTISKQNKRTKITVAHMSASCMSATAFVTLKGIAKHAQIYSVSHTYVHCLLPLQ